MVLRLGRFHAVKGPGLYLLWPIDTIATIIDLRIQTANITAEQALTRAHSAVCSAPRCKSFLVLFFKKELLPYQTLRHPRGIAPNRD